MAAKKSGSEPKKRKGGLPKKYIKAAGGDMKKAWAMYKSGKKPKAAKKSKAKPKSKAAKKKVTTTTRTVRTTRASEKKSPDVKLAIMIAKQKSDLASLEARYEKRRLALTERLSKASVSEKDRLQRKLQALLAERDAVIERYKMKAQQDKERIKQLEAAEETKRYKKKRKKGKRRNPITGWGESVSTIGGVAIGGIVLLVGDALISNRGNLQTNGTQLADQPAANGGVYMLSAQSLPVWKQFKHAGIWRILYALGNTGVPLMLGHFLAKRDHNKWAAFFQGWGYADTGIAIAKVSTDGLAALLGNNQFGFKAFPAQLSALNMAANASNLAAGTALTPMPVQAGSASKLGYGTAPSAGVLGAGRAGCQHVGAGQACCSNCAQSKQVPRGNLPQQPNCPQGPTPMTPANPGTPMTPAPGLNTQIPQGNLNPPSSTPLPGLNTQIPPGNLNPPSSTPLPGLNTQIPSGNLNPPTNYSSLGAQGAHPSNVTPIGSRKGSSLKPAGTGTRFDRSKFGI